ncbi:MAG: hypothetical protein KJO76_00275 [Gammaproteobacteria bacterium]|nr:hypothetical protein [Gammaproteobacteria bacterium]NND37174.1 hypothetical protein [Gammaproteobacteria bacterium]
MQTQSGSGLLAQTYTGVKLLSGAIGFTAESGSQTLGILFGEWIGFGGSPGASVAIGGGEKLEGVVGTKPIMFAFGVATAGLFLFC